MGGSVVRSAGSCGGSQIHCTLSKEGEGNVQCIAFEGLAVKRAARQVVMLRKHGKGKCRIERPLRIPVKIASMCTACWSREGVTNLGRNMSHLLQRRAELAFGWRRYRCFGTFNFLCLSFEYSTVASKPCDWCDESRFPSVTHCYIVIPTELTSETHVMYG